MSQSRVATTVEGSSAEAHRIGPCYAIDQIELCDGLPESSRTERIGNGPYFQESRIGRPVDCVSFEILFKIQKRIY